MLNKATRNIETYIYRDKTLFLVFTEIGVFLAYVALGLLMPSLILFIYLIVCLFVYGVACIFAVNVIGRGQDHLG